MMTDPEKEPPPTPAPVAVPQVSSPPPPLPPPLIPGPAAGAVAQPESVLQEYERRLLEMEERLLEEREKVLLANLKSQQEAATAAKVDASLGELRMKLSRDRLAAENEASSATEAGVHALEAALAGGATMSSLEIEAVTHLQPADIVRCAKDLERQGKIFVFGSLLSPKNLPKVYFRATPRLIEESRERK